MIGNGMAWGQLSHTLAWVLHVTGLQPRTVYAEMGHSLVTGAVRGHAHVHALVNAHVPAHASMRMNTSMHT